MTIEQLVKQHSYYKNNLSRLNFLFNSYLGGAAYRKGAYLRKYWGEDNAPFDAFQARLDTTPLDNHVKTTVDIYRSYIWRQHPNRILGNLVSNPFVNEFIKDADLDGQGIDSFLKTALDFALVTGYMWIVVDRPALQLESAAQEIEMGVRAYASMYTPQMVPDWKWEKALNGKKTLSYIKIIEYVDEEKQIFKEWYTDKVITTTVKVDSITSEMTDIIETYEVVNTLGKIPFICLAPQKSLVTGLGEPILGDVADIQRSIYNKLSELEQTIRMSGHPTLVKTVDTKATTGAGGVVTMPDNLDPGLKPFILQPSAAISSIIDAIDHDVDAINAMTHLGAIRAVKGSSQSGVALQTERQLLNSKLADLADVIEETEIKLWDLWFDWMDIIPTLDFNIEYYKTFDTKDTGYEIDILQQSLETITDPEYVKFAQKEIAKLTIKDEVVLTAILKSIDNAPVK